MHEAGNEPLNPTDKIAVVPSERSRRLTSAEFPKSLTGGAILAEVPIFEREPEVFMGPEGDSMNKATLLLA